MGIRYTVWMHREAQSVFGYISQPVNRDGLVLSFTEEQRAQAECTKLILVWGTLTRVIASRRS
jgi:hypothetical protein